MALRVGLRRRYRCRSSHTSLCCPAGCSHGPADSLQPPHPHHRAAGRRHLLCKRGGRVRCGSPALSAVPSACRCGAMTARACGGAVHGGIAAQGRRGWGWDTHTHMPSPVGAFMRVSSGPQKTSRMSWWWKRLACGCCATGWRAHRPEPPRQATSAECMRVVWLAAAGAAVERRAYPHGKGPSSCCMCAGYRDVSGCPNCAGCPDLCRCSWKACPPFQTAFRAPRAAAATGLLSSRPPHVRSMRSAACNSGIRLTVQA